MPRPADASRPSWARGRGSVRVAVREAVGGEVGDASFARLSMPRAREGVHAAAAHPPRQLVLGEVAERSRAAPPRAVSPSRSGPRAATRCPRRPQRGAQGDVQRSVGHVPAGRRLAERLDRCVQQGERRLSGRRGPRRATRCRSFAECRRAGGVELVGRHAPRLAEVAEALQASAALDRQWLGAGPLRPRPANPVVAADAQEVGQRFLRPTLGRRSRPLAASVEMEPRCGGHSPAGIRESASSASSETPRSTRRPRGCTGSSQPTDTHFALLDRSASSGRSLPPRPGLPAAPRGWPGVAARARALGISARSTLSRNSARRSFASLVALAQDQRPHAGADRVPLVGLEQPLRACASANGTAKSAGAPTQTAAAAPSAWTVWPAVQPRRITEQPREDSMHPGRHRVRPTPPRRAPPPPGEFSPVLEPRHSATADLSTSTASTSRPRLEGPRQVERDQRARARVAAQPLRLPQVTRGRRVRALLLGQPELPQHGDTAIGRVGVPPAPGADGPSGVPAHRARPPGGPTSAAPPRTIGGARADREQMRQKTRSPSPPSFAIRDAARRWRRSRRSCVRSPYTAPRTIGC